MNTTRRWRSGLGQEVARIGYCVLVSSLLPAMALGQTTETASGGGPVKGETLAGEPPVAPDSGEPPVAPDAGGQPVAPGEQTPESLTAIARALEWLAQQQQPDGSFGSLSHYGRHVGITGLAGLAFLSNGDTPGRGRYGRAVDGCIHFIVAHGSESGLLAAETSHGPMYGHGFATLFLAEVYGETSSGQPSVAPRRAQGNGMTVGPAPPGTEGDRGPVRPRRERKGTKGRPHNLRETLRKAIRLIATTQNDEGGWRYQPVRNDADLSVTVCQIMALRAARNAGLFVQKSVIDQSIEYVRNKQNPNGGFRYMGSSGTSAFARSAAGVAALQYAGIYGGETVVRGLEYCRKFIPPDEHSVGHYFYGHYYAAQAMYLAGDAYWTQWWPAIRDELLLRQDAQGYWRGQAGKEYGTAMALIILQMPNRLLPILQK